MRITTFPHAREFLLRAGAYLEREEALNNLPLGLALRLQRLERVEPAPFFAVGEEESGLALAAVMTPPHRLILYSDRSDPDLEPLTGLLSDSALFDFDQTL